jgi:metal-responsive CopG/Arc/MetJ family transcriptional regulator
LPRKQGKALPGSEDRGLLRTEVLNIRLPDDLILELDALVDKKAFKSRSEAVREFAREYVQSQLHVEEKEKAKKSGHGGEGW